MSKSSLLHLFDFDRYPPSVANLSGGLTQDSIYVWGMQVEKGTFFPTSYIPTTTATVTRTIDALIFDGASNCNCPRGAVTFDMLSPNETFTTDRTYHSLWTSAFALTVVTSYYTAANETLFTDGVYQIRSGVTTARDGNIHNIRNTWDANSGVLYQDDISQGTPGTSSNLPSGAATFAVGSNTGPAAQCNALISNLKVFGTPTLKK